MKFIHHMNGYQNKFSPRFDVTTSTALNPGIGDGKILPL